MNNSDNKPNAEFLSKKAEELLIDKDLKQTSVGSEQDNARKYSELFNFAPSGFFIITRDGVIEDVNTYGSKIIGMEASELKGRELIDILDNKSRPQFISFFTKIFEKKSKEECELTITSEGVSKCIFLVGNINADGNKCLIVAVDITERKVAEIEMKAAKEYAQNCDKLKTLFLANLSHEIRTPLNSIIGFSEMLNESIVSREDIQEYIRIIEAGSNRMLSIINNLVNISKIEAGLIDVNFSDFDINNHLKCIYDLYNQDNQNVKFVLSSSNPLKDKDAIIKTDREKLSEILSKLLDNAFKFTEKGFVEFGYNIIPGSSERIKEIEFFVKDSGIGVPLEKQELIFERFRQVSESSTRNYEGAGLGLTISRAYIEKIGGKIWVENNIESGSTFCFTIPYIKGCISENVREAEKRKPKILIAEDEETSDLLITIAVKKISGEVLHTRTGSSAVEVCREHPDIDIVLMDIKMPEMDGYEATRRIRQFNQKVLIIAQTAYGLEGDREKAIRAGCNYYFSKPLNLGKLTNLIKRHYHSC
jgi:PAS domain S-box-containing protein